MVSLHEYICFHMRSYSEPDSILDIPRSMGTQQLDPAHPVGQILYSHPMNEGVKGA
jgi:hypothetical protein